MAHVVELNSDVTEKSLSISSGSEIVVKLPGSPTTGYTWKFVQEGHNNGVVEQVGKWTYQQPEMQEGMCGGTGTFSFSFKAKAAGTTKLGFIYVRTWDKSTYDEALEHMVNVTVT
mmetsp:Transcript_12417/g.26823  ORF Transcript_12417/g.26823 Transcript_12417/m.26823 type:complete len:115 (+) Transcript_12417:52-396(+)